MRILVVNPNSSTPVAEAIARSARRSLLPTTEVVPLANPRGTRGIDCDFANYQSTWSYQRAVLKKVEEEQIDAVVLCGFGNVGIFALKEALSIPVVSISEAGMYIAAMMGHRFTIVTAMESTVPGLEDLLGLYGIEKKCCSVRAIHVDIEKCATEKKKTLNNLKDQILRVVEQDRAEVVLLGCGGLSGYDEELQALVGIPVIDPVNVAAAFAEMMVRTGLCHSKKLKFAAPPQPLQNYLD